MPVTYGMVAGRDHGCEKQPLTEARVANRDSFRMMRRYECVNIDDILGTNYRESKARERYMKAKRGARWR